MAEILVIDGDAAAANATTRTLSEAGYACSWFDDGDRALALLRWRWVDLVLIDEHLPGLSAAQVLREIRNSAVNHDTRVIVTGTCPEIEGADGYLIKPFTPGELLRKVENLLGTAPGPSRSFARA